MPPDDPAAQPEDDPEVQPRELFLDENVRRNADV